MARSRQRKEAKEKGEKSGSKDVGKAIRKTAREATKKEKEALGIEPKSECLMITRALVLAEM